MKARIRRWRPVLILVAAVSVTLSLINASWLAPKPPGRLTLVASGGVGQSYDRAVPAPCAASRIRADAGNTYIENTLPSLYKALRLGAQAVALPVRHTKDGQAVIFADATLDCRTDGKGEVAAHSLAEIKRLDAGFGYTPDGGGSFPLRGRGVGAIPTVEDALRYIPSADILFQVDQPADADALAAAFSRAALPVDRRFGFAAGSPAAAARLRQAMPGAWVYEAAEGEACLADYVRFGWTGFVPASCRGRTIVLPIAERWKLWGWPYRFFDRMADAEAKVLIVGARRRGELIGLDQPEQYDQVPRSFHGHLLVEDIWTMGPSLRR
jgi:glycerophosphoryl diester phosphodiesterase